MANATIQEFTGKVATIGDEVTVMWDGALYWGEVVSVDEETDTPVCRFDDYSNTQGGLTHYDGDKTLAPNGSWMWPHSGLEE